MNVEVGKYNNKMIDGFINILVNDEFVIRVVVKGLKWDFYLEGYYDLN